MSLDLSGPRPPPGSRPQSARGRTRPQSAQSRRTDSVGAGSIMSYQGFMRGQKMNHRPGSAGRRLLPAELGLAGQRVLTLPSHVDTCDQGENCCWRWLAHSVLKEASWLKDDLDAVRKDHEDHVESHTKAEHDAAAYAELRGAHGALQQELGEYRQECADLRRELMLLKAAHGQKVGREQELQKEVSRMEEEKKEFLAKENQLRSATEAMQLELMDSRIANEELKSEVTRLQDFKLMAEINSAKLSNERDELKKVVEGTQNRKGRRTSALARSSSRRRASSGGGYRR